ncbi:tRNA (guanosine(46)-N7)-methyltransferase TrmB [Evansella sp. AB-rgal1]|uniref:tRNA (guanosine(46)-N7)-methyltransferase TrmB n=1 Tax=Evansella sp. AB-rgal1 TaxID=3242696 RepID=UPI00359E7852
MRLRNKPWASKVIEENSQVVIPNPKECKGKWHTVFENKNPIHVEVGTGKGRFVTRMAEAHKDRNVIGMEKYDSVILTAVERIIEKPLQNIRLIKEDVELITDFFAPGEVDRLYINFTDPWPKNRHEKRRLTSSGFLQKYVDLLQENGEIHFKTDNEGLFEYSLESMSQFGLKLKNIRLDLHRSGMEGNIMTEYEERFVEKGMRIFRVEAYK